MLVLNYIPYSRDFYPPYEGILVKYDLILLKLGGASSLPIPDNVLSYKKNVQFNSPKKILD